MNIKTEFETMIADALDETGSDLQASKEEIAVYMSERAAHLSTLTTDPGFAQAVIAERNNVAMRAGLAVSDNARGVDQRLLGMIGGALRIAAAALA